jgi:hypothetical protein
MNLNWFMRPSLLVRIEVLVEAEQDFYREKWQKGIERERVT